MEIIVKKVLKIFICKMMSLYERFTMQWNETENQTYISFEDSDFIFFVSYANDGKNQFEIMDKTCQTGKVETYQIPIDTDDEKIMARKIMELAKEKHIFNENIKA